MGYLTNSQGLLTKEESPSGTFADPADKANAYANPEPQNIRIRELTTSVDSAKDDENSKYLTGTFAGDESIIGMTTGTVGFNVKMAPSQVTDNGDTTYDHFFPMDKYYGSVGLKGITIFDETNTVGDINKYQYGATYVYFPTIQKYEDTLSMVTLERDPKAGVDAEMSEWVGAYGNMTITADTAGSIFNQTFDYMAGVQSVEKLDSANVPNLDFNPVDVLETVADKFLNTTFRVKDVETGAEVTTICLTSLNLDLGVQRILRECSATTSGVKSYSATGMQPRLNTTFELPTLDLLDYWKGLTEERFYEIEIESSYKSENGVKVFNLFIPRAQLLNAGKEDNDNFRDLSIDWKPVGNITREGETPSLPSTTYTDATTGAEVAFDLGTVMTDLEVYEAMYYLTFKEVPVGYTPVPTP